MESARAAIFFETHDGCRMALARKRPAGQGARNGLECQAGKPEKQRGRALIQEKAYSSLPSGMNPAMRMNGYFRMGGPGENGQMTWLKIRRFHFVNARRHFWRRISFMGLPGRAPLLEQGLLLIKNRSKYRPHKRASCAISLRTSCYQTRSEKAFSQGLRKRIRNRPARSRPRCGREWRSRSLRICRPGARCQCCPLPRASSASC